ncbi:hypothetical protein ACQP2E_27430 [Actinoplanes sp. CA-015351]|uniref:hypothetical protein n=1 Tax=Actinoplanes sp. CA-015351 TaxID=3239897 RepID=UPI003D970951
MPLIEVGDPDFRVSQVSFEALLAIQREAELLGFATRWSSVEEVRSHIKEEPVILQSLMREERAGEVRSYRCLMLFAAADGSPSGGIATIDVDPARFRSLERLDRDPDVSRAFARIFALATGGIAMISKS